MYQINVEIEGISPLMQHRFPMPGSDNNQPSSEVVTGKRDYSKEWKDYFYTKNGKIVQPAAHIEAAMTKAAASFKIVGARGKSYKDLLQRSLMVTPMLIEHGYNIPDELDDDPDKPLYLDIRPVVVQRARVVRMRPTFKEGWKLAFSITVGDDQLPENIVQRILAYAGETVGIGDYRPKFGRFMIRKFEKVEV